MSGHVTTQNVSATERADRKAAPSNVMLTLIEGRYWAYLLIIPSMILVAAVVVYPVINGVLLSFREYRLNRPALGTPWIGLEHYQEMMTDPIVRAALRNTLIWVVVGSAHDPGAADAVFQRPEQLTHPALGQVEALRGPAEMQLVGQHQEALEFPDLQTDGNLPDR